LDNNVPLNVVSWLARLAPTASAPLHWACAGAIWHTLGPTGGLLQAYPGSTWQVSLQPSLSVKLPSSHCSFPLMLLLPQVNEHPPKPGPRQVNPGSSWQDASQPSPGNSAPSSQDSPAWGSMVLLPQLSTHVLMPPFTVQV